PPPACRARSRPCTGSRARPAGGTCPPARVGLHRSSRRDARLERVLPDDAVLLLLRVRRVGARCPRRLRATRMKVVVLTTSYPTSSHPVAGAFVHASVEAVRSRGVEVDVVSPSSFMHFGVALGSGIAQNLRAAAWNGAFVP